MSMSCVKTADAAQVDERNQAWRCAPRPGEAGCNGQRRLRLRRQRGSLAKKKTGPRAGYDPGVNDRFLRACRLQAVDRTPVWFMRQAGRYMPEYRALRAQHSLLHLCRTPELAVEVTLQPVRALGVDAAILFSDLLLPLAPLGIPFDFKQGEGPVIERVVRTGDDIDRLQRYEPREALGMVLEAIRLVRRELAGQVPLIGFGGAPFTLASYAIEGGHSSSFAATKSLMYQDPSAWHRF